MSMIKSHALLIMFAHYISNFIVGIMVRNKYVTSDNNSIIEPNNIAFTDSLTSAINSAMSTLLFILGTIVTFFVISSVIDIPFLKLILELSQGLNYLNSLLLNTRLKTILAGALLSFGGICIHFQVYGILSKIKIKYLPYLKARVIQAIITSLIIFLLCP